MHQVVWSLARTQLLTVVLVKVTRHNWTTLLHQSSEIIKKQKCSFLTEFHFDSNYFVYILNTFCNFFNLYVSNITLMVLIIINLLIMPVFFTFYDIFHLKSTTLIFASELSRMWEPSSNRGGSLGCGWKPVMGEGMFTSTFFWLAFYT